MVAHSPRSPYSRVYNIIVAHLIGMCAAYLAVVIFGIGHAPSVFAVHRVDGARVAAAVLAIAIGTAGELLAHAAHPPAASTTLLVALGSFKLSWHDASLIIIGVVIVTVAGEVVRVARLRLDPDSG